MHGTKKKEHKPLTEEEQTKLKEKMDKISKIQQAIYKKRQANDLSEDNLSILFEAGVMMNDNPTIWNYRKDILLSLQKSKEPEAFYELLCKDIEQTTRILASSPKSYTIWFHRLWCLKQCFSYELTAEIPFEKSAINKEIKLIDKFLVKDNRNFHAWNYRFLIMDALKEHLPAQYDSLVDPELEMTLTMINNNFSNFSAFHYRSKLLPVYFARTNLDLRSAEAFDFFKKEFELLDNALNTDDKNQTLWNYHMWCVNVLISLAPRKVTVVEEDDSFVATLEYAEVLLVNEVYSGDFEVLNKERLSNVLVVRYKGNVRLDGTGKSINYSSEITKLSSITLKGKEVKVLDIDEKEEALLREQIKLIEELMDENKFKEQVLSRLAWLKWKLFELKRNEEGKLGEEALKIYSILAEKSERMKGVYAKVVESIKM